MSATHAVVDLLLATFEPERWQGLDEAVVERFAAEAGRTPRAPLIPTDQGDLPLFLFLLAGLAAGFVLGYTFRVLFVEQARRPGASP